LEKLEDRTVLSIVLNNGVLTVTANTTSSSIGLALADSGAVGVTLDSQQQNFSPGQVNSIVVNGLGGSDTLTVSDVNTASGHTYTLTGSTLNRSGAQPISFSNIPNLTLDAGNSGNTIDWQGDASGEVDTVYSGTGTNTINFGDTNNTLNSFGGMPILQGQGSSNTVNVYDQGNTSPRNYVLTADSLSPNGGSGFGYGYDIQAANIYLGSGGNTLDWQGTPGNSIVSVYTGTGTNTINFGDTSNTLNGFSGTPVLYGQGSNNTVNVYDQGTTTPRDYVITADSFSPNGGEGFGYGNDIQTVNYYLGSGGNTVDWQGVASGVNATLYTGTGTNTINFGDANNTLNSFGSDINLVGQGSNNTVNVYDQGTTTPRDYVLGVTPGGAGSFSLDGGADYSYGSDIQTVNYYLGSGGNTVDWQGIPGGQVAYLYTGTGANTINFGDANNTLDGFSGAPVVEGQGSDNTVNVYDQGTTTPRSYVLTPDSLSPNGGEGFGYGVDIQTANYYLGQGGNTVDWQGVAAGETVTVYTGAGANTVNFGDTNNTLDGFAGTPILQGQGSDNTVNVYDQGTTTPRDYVLTADSLSPNGGEGFGYGYDIQAANIYLGSGGNTLDWQGTAAGSVTTVYTGTGTNTINFGDANNTLDGFQGTPVLDGQGSNNTVNVYDQGSANPHTYVITGSTFSRDGGTGYYSGIQILNAYLGSGGNLVDWQGDSATTTLYTGSGVNTINFGDANNTLYGFPYLITLVGQGSNNTVNVYNQGDTTPGNYIIGVAPGNGVAFSLNGGFDYDYGYDVQTVSYYLGSGGNTVDWQGVPGGQVAYVYTGTGANTINFGDANNTLNSFDGTPVLEGQGSNNTVNVYDQGTTTPRDYVLTPDSLSPNGGEGFGYGYDIQAANYYLGSGGNTIDWQGTASGETVTVYTGTGNNVITVGDANDTLDGFQGTPILQGQGSQNAVYVRDDGSTTPHTYVITGSSVSRDGGTGYYYDIQSLTLYFGSGGNTIDWQGTPAPTTTAPDKIVAFGDSLSDTGNDYILSGGPQAPYYDGRFSNGPNWIDQLAAKLGVPDPQPSLAGGTNYAYGGATATDLASGIPDLAQQIQEYLSNPSGVDPNALYTVLMGANDFFGGITDASVVANAVDAGLESLIAAGAKHILVSDLPPQGITPDIRSQGPAAVAAINALDAAFNADLTADVASLRAANPGVTLDELDLYSTSNAVLANPGAYGFTDTTDEGYFNQNKNLSQYLFWDAVHPTTAGHALIADSAFSAAVQGVTVYTGTGANTINVGDANNTLDGFLSTPVLVGQGTNNTLNINDSGSTNSHTYAVTNTRFSRDGGSGYFSDVQAVNIQFGTGANTVNWQAVSSAATAYTADFSGGSDQVTGAFSAAATTVNGAVSLNGATAAFGNLTITSQGSLNLSQAATGAITASSVSDQGTITGSGHLSLLDSGDLSSGNLDLMLGGTTAGTSYDQIQVGGTATLTGSLTIGLVPGFVPTPGETFTILEDTGGNPVNGTFTNLPNGAQFYVDGTTFQIGYDGADVVLTVDQDATTTAVTSSANPSALGQSVTFTATVSSNVPGASTPTGSVSFLDGTKVIGSGTLSGGVATFTTSSLALGTHSITASYAGTSDFSGGASTAISQVVEVGTSTTVTSSAAPSVYGQSVTFTATVKAVAPGTGTPAGSVTFLDGSTTLGTATLSGGKATFKTSALVVANHSITVSYAGNSSFLASTSSALTQTVNQDASTTSLTSSVNPAVTGESVTFTATVKAASPGSGTPTGSVTFLENGAPVDTATLSGGKATFKTSLTAGSYSVTVSYGGDGNFTGNTSPAVTQAVNQDATSTTVSSSASTSVYGQGVTFTATVKAASPGSGTPTGSVTFMDGSTVLGSALMSGNTATFGTSTLAFGSHSITAVYTGDGNFITSTSPARTQTVNAAGTTTVVTSSLNPSAAGQSVTFTATVTVNSPGSGTPGGTVTFRDGSKVLGTGTLNASGQATYTTSSLAVGKHSITASYTASTDYKASTSATLTQTVNTNQTVSSPPPAPIVLTRIPSPDRVVTSLLPELGSAGSTRGGISAYASVAGVGTVVTIPSSPTNVLPVSWVITTDAVVAAQPTGDTSSSGTNVAALDKVFADLGKDGLTGPGAEGDPT
jgi:phospholipase/lecithinase/hemolysin